MQFFQNPHLDLLTCPTCNGAGFLGYKRCSECRGLRIGRVTSKKFIYFGEQFTRYHISLRHARRFLDRLRIFLPLIVGFGLIGLFLFTVEKKQWWDETQEKQLLEQCKKKVDNAVEEYFSTPAPQVQAMFDYLYAELSLSLKQQREQAILRGQKNG